MTASRITFQSDFYVTGGTLRRDAPSYVVREADSELHEGLSRGHYCYVLTSRQMGKSSLMVQVAAQLREGGAGVTVLDLTAVGQNVTAEQWYGGLMTQMAQQLDLEDELFDFWQSHLDLGPMQRWKQAIEKVVLPRYIGSVIIFVDEIDAVRSLPFSTDEFFAGIREFYNSRTENEDLRRLTFCLLGVATPSDLIRDTRTTPFNIGRRIELHDFTESEARPLARGLGRDNETGALLLGRVLHWTGGHPYLTQRLCQAVAEDQNASSAEDVDRLCEEMFLSSRARERDDNLLFVRERMLRSEIDLAGLLTFYEQSLRGKRVRDDETNPLVSVMRLSGIVRAEGGFLKVRNRIYEQAFDREWVKSNMPDSEIRRQREAYRRGVLRAAAVAALILVMMAALVVFAVRNAQAARTALAEAETQKGRAEAARIEAETQRGRAEAALEEAQKQQKSAEENSRREARQRSIADEERNRADRNFRQAESNAQKAQAALVEANQQRKQAEEQRRLAEERDRSNHRLWYAAAMNQAQDDWESANIKRMLSLLDASVPDVDQEDLRGFEWYYLWRLCHGDLTTFDHGGSLFSVALSPDGKTIASAGSDGTVKMWDVSAKQLLFALKGHARGVNSVAFSPDGKTLATAGGDQIVILWDAATGRKITSFNHKSPVFSVVFSPNGKILASGCVDRTARLWSIETHQETVLGPHAGRVNALAFSPDGEMLAAAGVGQRIRLWNTATGQSLFDIDAESSLVYSLAFSPDGRKLVAGNNDHFLRGWDIATRRQEVKFHAHTNSIRSVAFSSDGKTLVSGGSDRAVKLWTWPEHRLRTVLKGHTGAVSSLSLLADGKILATAGSDGTVKLWDAVAEGRGNVLEGRAGDIRALAFSSDGQILATGNQDGTVKLWNADSGKEIKTIKAHEGQVFSMAFSPDGRKLVSAGRDGATVVWDTATGRELHRLERHTGGVNSVAFSPDGLKIALSAVRDRALKVYDASAGRLLISLAHQSSTNAVAFSPDGRKLASGASNRIVKVWDTETWQELFTLAGHEDVVLSVAFSPDSKTLASGCRDGSVKLWDVDKQPPQPLLIATSQPYFTLDGHVEPVYSVAFSTDGKRLATASGDRTVKLWDMETKEERITLRGHGSPVYSVAFSPDGRKLVSASGDDTVRIWRAVTVKVAPKPKAAVISR